MNITEEARQAIRKGIESEAYHKGKEGIESEAYQTGKSPANLGQSYPIYSFLKK